jgi:hypothetical protein
MQMVMAFAATAASIASSAGSAVAAGASAVGSGLSTAASAVGSGMSAVGSMMGMGGASGAAGSVSSLASAAGAGESGFASAASSAGSGAFGLSRGLMSDIGFGSNTVSALSQFGMNQMQQQGIQQQAFTAQLQSRQDYIAAADRANQTNEQFIRTMGGLYTDAAAGGIDIASGSVQAARRTAEQDKTTALSIDRNNAAMNGAMAQSSADFMRRSASATGINGVLSFGTKLAQNVLQLAGSS